VFSRAPGHVARRFAFIVVCREESCCCRCCCCCCCCYCDRSIQFSLRASPRCLAAPTAQRYGHSCAAVARRWKSSHYRRFGEDSGASTGIPICRAKDEAARGWQPDCFWTTRFRIEPRTHSFTRPARISCAATTTTTTAAAAFSTGAGDYPAALPCAAKSNSGSQLSTPAAHQQSCAESRSFIAATEPVWLP
jgi:hypothetical protein